MRFPREWRRKRAWPFGVGDHHAVGLFAFRALLRSKGFKVWFRGLRA